MTVDLVVRAVCLVGCAVICGVAIGRAFARRSVLRWLCITVAAFAGNGILGQATLLHDPLTVRTFGSLICTAVGLTWIVVLQRKGPPRTEDDPPPKETP